MISSLVENGSNSVISLVKDYPVVSAGLTLFALGTFFMMGKKEDIEGVNENPKKELTRDRIIGSNFKYPDTEKIFEKLDLQLNKPIVGGCEYIFNKDFYQYSWSWSRQDLTGLASEFLLKTNRNSYKLKITNYTKYDAMCDEAGYLLLDGFRMLSLTLQARSQNKPQWDSLIFIYPFKEHTDLLYISQTQGQREIGNLIFLDKEKKGLTVSWIGDLRKFEKFDIFLASEIEDFMFKRKIFEIFKSTFDEGSAFGGFPHEIIQLIANKVIA